MATLTEDEAREPANYRTFTLTEMQVSDIIDTLSDRIEMLRENMDALDLHTADDIDYFTSTIDDLREIRAILDGAVSE